ncbi:hypothetical protein LTR62_005677 [Meristemomyces frigidus]|uniref:Splicing factor Cactin n=1 Tax=Meristemomyces frigidus TaxID=1508187 RepID=A0AAN7TCV8_9PEZI|nr:hypothetical protein LTR62_005677 [Meristemomyces frigidus]
MSRASIPAKRSAPDAQEAAWVADEDRFVLEQSKKKAAIRVKGGRGGAIDWLAVILAASDPDRDPLDDEVDLDQLDLRDPVGVFAALDEKELAELEKGIDGYLLLEHGRHNVEYWRTMKTTCAESRKNLKSDQAVSARGVSSVAGDLDKLLAPKDLEGLEKLEKQIKTKLASDAPIDTDYWEHLLSTLLTYKAKARLKLITESIVRSRLMRLREQQGRQADARKDQSEANTESDEDRLDLLSDADFAKRIGHEQQQVSKEGFIAGWQSFLASATESEPSVKRQRTSTDLVASSVSSSNSSAQAAFDKDLSKTLQTNEQLLTTEENVITKGISSWPPSTNPRKPRYFARQITGYEWNKYNQTHYDADNPPPKIIQGYKFNILYPDLADITKAPTYKIERSDGRRRGETRAEAGEEDACLIRFVAGAPYEDIGFRIVDREWDFSAKSQRGFRSKFEKGVLQLHFQFKKIYYRK